MLPFRYDPEILPRFPRLAYAALLGQGLRNGSTPAGLRQAYLDEQRRVLEKIGTTPLSEIESLAGWRAAFRLFGVDPTQYRSVAEALLRRLTKKGDIPCINAVVDACNLVSIRYALPVAAFDLRSLKGAVWLLQRHPPFEHAQASRISRQVSKSKRASIRSMAFMKKAARVSFLALSVMFS